tara:strand:+ start:1322 stop:1594 length:273 start_codon:yes stop_codon:yes gene_type:complete
MNLTPFEKVEIGQRDRAILSAAIATTSEMIRLIDESEAQVQAFKDWITSGEQVTDIERDLVGQALKDADVANQALVAIASLMEEKYGICA